MVVDQLTNGSRLIQRNPCDERASAQNFSTIRDQLSDVVNKLNETITITNLVSEGDTISEETIINNIVNNTTFQNTVNNYVSNYLNNYFNNLYADHIKFAVTTALTKSGDIWTGQGSVTAWWQGKQPPATVSIQDPAGIWRWMAPVGAKGTAIRANDGGTLYTIVSMETIAHGFWGQFQSDFTETDDHAVMNILEIQDFPSKNPMTFFGGSIYVANPPNNKTGDYIFEGSSNDYGYAKLRHSDTKPANNSGDCPYTLVQIECP